jgi:cytochrome o ubiquinol oxidase operon protein cyoD
MTEQHAIKAQPGAGTKRSYRIGFLLSVVLTMVAFAAVSYGGLPRSLVVPCIVAAAAAQILVHLSYFLHLSAAPEQRWNLLAICLTALIVVIILGGSIWIMVSLHEQMMVGDPMNFGSWVGNTEKRF